MVYLFMFCMQITELKLKQEPGIYVEKYPRLKFHPTKAF